MLENQQDVLGTLENIEVKTGVNDVEVKEVQKEVQKEEVKEKVKEKDNDESEGGESNGEGEEEEGEEDEDEEGEEEEEGDEENDNLSNISKNGNIKLEIEDNSDTFKNLEEFKLDIDDINDIKESISLKNPNEVYFEIYKDARKKAKDLRKNTLAAYLDAKNIKTKYMLEEIDDSDDEFDYILTEN